MLFVICICALVLVCVLQVWVVCMDVLVFVVVCLLFSLRGVVLLFGYSVNSLF